MRASDAPSQPPALHVGAGFVLVLQVAAPAGSGHVKGSPKALQPPVNCLKLNAGIGPDRYGFVSRKTVVSFLSEAKFCGSVPVKLFVETSREARLVSCPSPVGKVPLIMLFEKSSVFR